MGYHIILDCVCRLKPEYIAFIEKEYLRESMERFKFVETDELENEIVVSEDFKCLLRNWFNLGIEDHFYKYKLVGDIFSFHIEKKPHRHSRDSLEDDYMGLMMNVIVPISEEVTKCEVSHDDWGFAESHYSNAYLQRKYVELNGGLYGGPQSNGIIYYD